MKFFLTVLFISLKSVLQAQTGYAVNDVTGDFPINKILNGSQSSSSFQNLKDRLVVIDFFGTWCVPCVRALPKLSALQDKYKNQIRIILVSDESQNKLEGFIKKQSNLTLPVVVDEQGIFTKLFQPPAYPYTVIVGKDGKVIAIPVSEDINEANIAKWLSEQNVNPVVIFKTNKADMSSIPSANDTMTSLIGKSNNKLVQLSQDFMYAAKKLSSFFILFRIFH